MKRGRNKLKRITVSLPKRLHLVLKGIAMGDERKLSKLVREIIQEKLQTSTVAELQLLVNSRKEEEEEEGESS